MPDPLAALRKKKRLLEGGLEREKIAMESRIGSFDDAETAREQFAAMAKGRLSGVNADIEAGEKEFFGKRKKKKALSTGSNASGRRGSILTGGSGVTSPLGSKRKTLLGG